MATACLNSQSSDSMVFNDQSQHLKMFFFYLNLQLNGAKNKC